MIIIQLFTYSHIKFMYNIMISLNFLILLILISQQTSCSSSHVKKPVTTRTRLSYLQYTMNKNDVPSTRSTTDSDTLCLGICHPFLLKKCHFDKQCIRREYDELMRNK